MTVATTGSKITYSANGVTTVWSFSFAALNTTEILLYVTDSSGNVTLINPILYSVSLTAPIAPNPTPGSGLVTYPLTGPALATGNKLTILRNCPAVQNVSFSNQSTLYPFVIEQVADYLTMIDQGDEETFGRAFVVQPSDPNPAPVPSVAQRANQSAIWDASGNLTAGLPAGGPGGTPVSPAMQPVVGAATLLLARNLMGVELAPVVKTGAYSLVDADDRGVIILAGNAFYTFSVAAAAAYNASFSCIVINGDSGRGKRITISGGQNFILWPGQTTYIFKNQTIMGASNPGRWVQGVATTVSMFVDPVNGNDNNDGLATGTGAFLTIQAAINTVQSFMDANATINLAAGTYDVGLGLNIEGECTGSQGLSITGASLSNTTLTTSTNNARMVNCYDGGVVYIRGVKFTATGTNCTGLFSFDGGEIVMSGSCEFGDFGTTGYHVQAQNNSVISLTVGYNISAGARAAAHIYAISEGCIRYGPSTGSASVVLLGTFTYTNFLQADGGSTIWTTGTLTFVNPASGVGKRYVVSANSAVTVGGGGALPPGTIAGTTATGGQFI